MSIQRIVVGVFIGIFLCAATIINMRSGDVSVSLIAPMWGTVVFFLILYFVINAIKAAKREEK